MKYLTFDFDLWPWGQGHENNNFYVFYLSASMVQIWAKSITSSPRKLNSFLPRRRRTRRTTTAELWL